MNGQNHDNHPSPKPFCYRHSEVPSITVCFGCQRPVCQTCITLTQGRVYCPECYAMVELTNTQVEEKATKKKFYYSIAFVLLMLFVVAGPFALPLLWRSPNFNGASKLILTILVIIITIFLIWLIYWLSVAILIPRYREMMQIMR
jgi:magnesium-transporting ATPase (P-type)